MAVETVQNEKEKIKVSPQGWLALVIMLCMFSGFFANMEGPLQFLRVLDLNTLIGSFGTIGDTGANFMGSGGASARDGFMFALSLAPGCIFSMGLIEVFTPILRPLLGLPGSCGLAFVNSLNGSDIAAVLTKELYDNGQITDDERTIFVSFMYPGSAPIGNMISTQAAVLPIAVIARGPMILLVIFCKLVGANIVRLIVMRGKKKNAEVAK